MKISMPNNLETPFTVLMRSMPEELQADKQVQNAVLVYLKLNGVRLARQYVESRVTFLNYDPMEIDTGFRFPRLQEVDAEEGSDENDDADDKESEENGENEDADENRDED
jgi:hypothetical protein